MKKEVPLSLRIYADSAYTDLVRSIGWLGKTYPIPKEEFDRLNAKHGKEKLIKAADELLEYDTEEKLAKLKDSVRKFCWQMLGPPPEAWDEFYADVANPPPNPYKSKKDHIPDDGKMVKDKTAERLRSEEPRRMVPPPEMTAEEMVRKLPDAELLRLLEDAKWALNHHGAKSRQGRQFKKDVAMAEAEVARRNAEKGEAPSEVDLLRSMHGRKLRKLLLSQHVLMRNYPLGNPTHDDAAKRTDLIEGIMGERGQKIPERPTVSLREDQVEDSDAELDAVAEALANTIREETGMDCVVAHPDELRRFREATNYRLREFLDMAEYEAGKYGPDTVTHQEAVRDIALIMTELTRRRRPAV